jgi:hypothetical protein
MKKAILMVIEIFPEDFRRRLILIIKYVRPLDKHLRELYYSTRGQQIHLNYRDWVNFLPTNTEFEKYSSEEHSK